MSNQDVPRFSGFAMGGYGELSDLSEDLAAIELIVPLSMLRGVSLNDMNGREYREKFAAMLLEVP